MPLNDARSRTFGLNGPADVFAKLEWEDSRLHDAMDNHEHISAACYIALNAATTAWHLCDWVCDDLSAAGRWQDAEQFGVRDKPGFINLALTNRSMKICWQLANAWKHRSLQERTFRSGYETRDSFLFFGNDDGVQSVVRYLRVRFPGGDFDIKIVTHEAINWWRDMLRALGYLIAR